MRMKTSLRKLKSRFWTFFDPEYEKPTSSLTYDDQNHEAATFAIRSSDEFLCCKKGTSVESFCKTKIATRFVGSAGTRIGGSFLNVAPGEVMKLNKAAYRLVEAPVEWYISISTVLEEHGWHRLNSDPCCWMLINPDRSNRTRVMESLLGLSVPSLLQQEDMLTTLCLLARKVIKCGRPPGNDYEIIFAGTKINTTIVFRVEHQKGGSFLLSQSELVHDLREIQIPSHRRTEKLVPCHRRNRPN